jgi:hypothetical protein
MEGNAYMVAIPNSHFADAIEACNWAGSPIGNKAILESVVARLRSLPSWTSVDDALPEKYQEVMIWPYINDDRIMTAQLMTTKSNKELRWMYADYVPHHGIDWFDCRPTHWMPMPSPPPSDIED